MKVRFKRGWRKVYATLTPGNVYRVIAIEADLLRIIHDAGEPILFKPQAFEVVDPAEPVEWISEIGDDGEHYACPPELRDPPFLFERWHDGDPAARAKLHRYIRERCARDVDPGDDSANGYLRVRWLHTHADRPTMLYRELDEARYEVRKVEVYADGRITYATGNGQSGDTCLSAAAVPPIAEIAAMAEFEPEVITRAEFEAFWDKAFEPDDDGSTP